MFQGHYYFLQKYLLPLGFGDKYVFLGNGQVVLIDGSHEIKAECN